MIVERKSPTFERAFAWWIERRVRRTFARVLVSGLGEARALSAERPLLIFANHTSWWDGPAAIVLLTRLLHLDARVMMAAEGLARFPFFRLLGAFGFRRGDPRDAARALRHGARALDRPGRALLVFPQGVERPVTARPLGLEQASAALARLAPEAAAIPLALRFEMTTDERPWLLARFGPPVAPSADVHAAREAHEAALDRALAHLDEALVRRRLDAFEEVHRAGRRTLAELMSRALGAMARSAARDAVR